MTKSENRMMTMRPAGPSTRRAKPLPCGMRSFIFCRAVFASEFATTNNSLMTACGADPLVRSRRPRRLAAGPGGPARTGGAAPRVPQDSYRLAAPGEQGRGAGEPGGGGPRADRGVRPTVSAGFLPAAGAGIEVQVDGIPGDGDADKVADIDSEALRRANDMHVVCLYGKVQFACFIQYVLAESVIGLILAVHSACNFRHISLQFEVPQINRGEHGAETEQGGEDRRGSGDAPSGNRVHERPDSLPGAQSSVQIFSELGVHSAPEMPEM